MKLKKIFFISGFCIIIFLLISCGENKQKLDFTVSSNITNGKIQTDDTLTIRVNSINKNLSGISFEIKSNNKVREIKPINLNSEINSEYKFLLNNITLGKKELFIKAKNTSKKISFTLLNHINPTVLDYEILNVFERPNNSFTQGLEFYNDTLYESLGQYGKSKLVKVDYRNGNILKEYKLRSNFFAEGITVLNNKIYQLTWKEKIGFVYDVNTFDQINSFEYNKSLEGWGICNDGSKLYKSDGTEKIWLLDPDNQKEDGFIENFIEKPKPDVLEDWQSAVPTEYKKQGKLYLASMGIYIFKKDFLDMLFERDTVCDSHNRICDSHNSKDFIGSIYYRC